MRQIDAYKRDRQARIAEARAVHEYSELLDCTFTPAITRRVPQSTGPVVVRGLERYMELQVTLLHCTVLCCAVLHFTLLCCAVLPCILLCCAVLSCISLCCAVLSPVVLCCPVFRLWYNILL